MGFQRQETEQRAGRKQQSSRRVRQIREQQDSSDSDSDEFCNQTFVLGNRSKDSYKIDVSVNSAKLTMEVDTSAAVSIISQAQLRDLLPALSSSLKPASIRLKTYTGEHMKIAGVAQVEVTHRESLLLFVVEEQGTTRFIASTKLEYDRLRTD